METIITHAIAFGLGALAYALVIRKNPKVQADVAKVEDEVKKL